MEGRDGATCRKMERKGYEVTKGGENGGMKTVATDKTSLRSGIQASIDSSRYGISILNSKNEKFYTLQCDRGGSYRDRNDIGVERKKSSVSRLVECPFRIIGGKGRDGIWVFKPKHLAHNHDPSTNISGHPSFSQLSTAKIQSVKDMIRARIPPRKILSSLRQQISNLPAISRTIYNAKKKFEEKLLGDRSEIGALYEELQKGGFLYDILRSSEGLLTHKEDEENYIWALNAFKEIIGHTNHPLVIMKDRELALMNAITNVFPSALENVAYSTTEAIFLNNWAEFEFTYINKKNAIEYIKNIWLPSKEKFVSPWTERYLHFRNRASSRAEGANSKLKMYLQNSTRGFHKVMETICHAVEHEFNEIKVKIASQKIQVPHYCNNPIYRDLLYHVSQFALKEICQQYEKIKKGTMAHCIDRFMTTMGLLCAHKLKESKEMTFSLELIHPQWRIDTSSMED
ncbi:uncharacterized protein [Rutidosis leptorrhynchoides]|uniref:uncharacterized protein n=1 Tax=Rutidosis leptorrhynchoides TaxID=125765 RepID=UPI003A99A2A9